MEAWQSQDNGNIVVAVRGTGTDFGNLGTKVSTLSSNVISDFGFGTAICGQIGIPPCSSVGLNDVVSQGVRFLNNISTKYLDSENTIILTGHSLGGGVAQILGNATGFDTVGFNAPKVATAINHSGVKQFTTRLNDNIKNPDVWDTSNMINIVIKHDPVHTLPPWTNRIGHWVTLPDDARNLDPLHYHQIDTVISVMESIHNNKAKITAYSPPDCTPAPAFTTKQTPSGVSASDPNDKVGPTGAGKPRWIPRQPLPYDIFFTNEKTARAPAQSVTVSDQLDLTKVDPATFTFGLIAFGSHSVTPPPGKNPFSAEVDLRPAQNLIVQITAQFNTSSGLATWNYQSIDPATGLPPANPTVGFLPPDTSPPNGEGSVVYSVKQLDGLPTGTAVSNMATIVFDQNAPISTQAWTNTLDSVPPTSHVGALPSTETDPSFPVSWSGTDDASGVARFTIRESDNGAPFTAWLSNTLQTSATFPGVLGHTYGFYSIAQDNAGNVEAAKSSAETSTTVTLLPFPISVTPKILNFGKVKAGTHSKAKKVTIANRKKDKVAVLIEMVADSGNYSEVNGCPATLDANKKCKVSVTFNPVGTGKQEGKLIITDNAHNSPQTVVLIGRGK